MTLDFTQHQTQARWTGEVNEGYSACLNGTRVEACPYYPQDSDPAQAWQHGWRMAATYLKGK